MKDRISVRINYAYCKSCGISYAKGIKDQGFCPECFDLRKKEIESFIKKKTSLVGKKLIPIPPRVANAPVRTWLVRPEGDNELLAVKTFLKNYKNSEI